MQGGGLEFFSGGYDSNGIKHLLQSPDPAIQAAAIKQVIANMTVGKDQSTHFTDVAKLVQSNSLAVKKLVYLYLMQNAKSQPDKAVMHAGHFVRDATHESPVIRGVAVRTMASLQVPAMTSFANEVMLKGLRDSDPYVRRNAALGVLKLYQVAPDVLQENGLLQDLVELLGDTSASVVAATVSAICELVTIVPKPEPLINAIMNSVSDGTLLNALNECSEWSQVYLLQGVSLFFIENLRRGSVPTIGETESVVERVLTYLQSTNPAVVMGTVNVVVNFLQAHCHSRSALPAIQQAELERRYSAKIAPALVSLVSTFRAEIRFVALRNVRVVVQRFKESLVPHINSFFLKFDDPIYIKLEKLEIMISLTTRANAEIVLAEMVEYASEVDIELVRKAVRSIGIIAVKVPTVAPQCVERLVSLIESRVSYIVQEAAIVVQTLLRQYPGTYAAIIVTLCKALDVLDDPESKAAVVWVLGEYAERIDNISDLIKLFFDGFPDEPLVVQLAVLTAAVKIYFVQSLDKDMRQGILERGIGLATQSSRVDLRDRGCFYWRLLLSDPGAAAKIVFSEKDRIADSGAFDRSLLQELLRDAGRLSSVLHCPISAALGDGRRPAVTFDESDDETDDQQAARAAASGDGAVATARAPAVAPTDYPLERSTNYIVAPLPSRALDFVAVLDGATAGAGLGIVMAWEASTPLPRLHTRFSLTKNVPSARVVLMQLNLNCWGLGFAEEFGVVELRPGQPADIPLAVCTGNPQRSTSEIQVAVKAEPMGVLYFIAPPIPPSLMIAPAVPIDPSAYAQQFTALQLTWSLPASQRPRLSSPAKLSPQHLRMHGMTLVHRRDEGALIGLHLYCECINGSKMLAEVTLENLQIALINVKTPDEMLADFFGSYLLDCLRA